MKKKLLIISRNNVPTQFWSLFIDLELTTIWKWCRSELPIPGFDTIEPDLILVDDYFGPAIQDSWLEQIIGQIRTNNFKNDVICVSPVFLDPSVNSSAKFADAHCFSFSESFLDHLKRSFEYEPLSYAISA